MLEYWFMLPVAVVISSMAMMSGIGGATLFSPFFMVVLGLDPLLALASGLLIEVFGFSSGVIGYIRKKTINFFLVRKLVVLTLPATIIGVALGRFFPVFILKVMLGLLLLYLAYKFYCSGTCMVKHHKVSG